ncbi:unannotated protein [freshwater metagenome]|uniref:Unannotated protein n=1 Tax=freshwater metagenome TaxID=449393 RepID=A0A6J7GME9_9ZZZZ
MRVNRNSPIIRDMTSLGGFGRAWSVGIVAFSAARALLAWPALARYGVNPWLFLAIDLLTAPPYGISQAVTVKILRDPDRPPRDALGWCAMVVAMFLAPYVYIFAASGEMPALAYAGLAAWMVLFGLLAVLRTARQVREPNESQNSETLVHHIAIPASPAESPN